MIGIIVFAALGLWLAIAYRLALALSHSIAKIKWKKRLVFVSLFVPLFILPIFDDLVIGWEFRQLCEKYSTVEVDRATAKGKTVYFVASKYEQNIKVEGWLMKASLRDYNFLDVETDADVVSYIVAKARGGFLTKISPVLPHLTFKTSCRPKEMNKQSKWFDALDINEVDNPNEILKEKK